MVFFLGFLFCGSIFAAESDKEFARKKAEILVEKGLKSQQRGKVEEALEAFDDAYETYPANKLPLLLTGEVLCHFGLFSRASQAVASITVNSLSQAEKGRYYHLTARIAIANSSMEEAAVAYADVLKFRSDDQPAKIRLAFINEFFGSRQRVNELLSGFQPRENLGYRDRAILFCLRLQQGDFLQGMSEMEDLAPRLESVEFQDDETPVLLDYWKKPLLFFLANLPIGFGNLIGVLYLIFLLGLLAILATQLIPSGDLRTDILFVIFAVISMHVAWRYGIRDLQTAILSINFDFYSPTWIIPRLLTSMHFVTFGLFFIFPIFRALPERMRPLRHELYAIWFFCYWFMVFVLVFQSRLPLTLQLTYMGISFAIGCVFSGFMPMGRYVIFLVAGGLGFGGVFQLDKGGIDGGSSFTDAKIKEAKAIHLLENEEFDEVIGISKKVLANFEKKAFSGLWVALIKALTENEDFDEATALSGEYLKAFGNSSAGDPGLLATAFLKSMKGDVSGALAIIQGISEARAKSFSSEQIAGSLYILGRCNLSYNESVQAHIDFSKALESAVLPLTKAQILFELCLMDLKMNRVEWARKWASQATSLGGGRKTRALVKTIESMGLFGQQQIAKALEVSQEACKILPRNGRSSFWQGHILCSQNKYTDAEILLNTMTAGSGYSEMLMHEITTKVK